METYTLIYQISSQGEFAVGFRDLKSGLCDTRGATCGGKWEGDSRGRGHMHPEG